MLLPVGEGVTDADGQGIADMGKESRADAIFFSFLLVLIQIINK
jgi:hypothetical protein